MDLITLHKTTYLPVELFTSYSSLVWTERFPLAGELEIVTNDIFEAQRVLPEGTLVSLLQTKEIMRIDTHLIEESDEGEQTLKITGSTFDQFLKERVTARYTKKGHWKMRREYSPPQAAAAYVWNAVVNPSKNDATGSLWTGYDYERWLNDNLPNFSVSLTLSGTYSGRNTFLEPSVVYDQLEKLLARKTLGMRTLRPPNSNGEQFYEASLASDGAFQLDAVTKANARYDIYDGVDRSFDQSTNPRVVFRQDLGHLLQVTKLTSSQSIRNAARVILEHRQETFAQSGVDVPNTTGLNWRVMLLDLSSEDESDIGFASQNFTTLMGIIVNGFQDITQPAFNQSDDEPGDKLSAVNKAQERMAELWNDFEDNIKENAYDEKSFDRIYKKFWSDVKEAAMSLCNDIVKKGNTRQNTKSTTVNRINIVKANASPSVLSIKSVAELELRSFMNDKAQDALIKANRVVSVSGSSSVMPEFIFGKDYFLGDKVTLQDETGALRTTHRVTEYIRIEDENGEVEYPGLTNLTETS